MKLLREKLTNFMIARSDVFEPQGNDASIIARNGLGKTTRYSAILWLLFNKDSDNRGAFAIKTLGPDQKPIPNIDHTVEGEFEIGGTRLALKKTYKEVWKREREAPAKTFSGHTTDHFINGVPVQEKEYKARIDSICSEKTFRMLTDVWYFNQTLPWQERRKKLLEVCGDVSDADVISANSKLAELPKIIGTYTIEEYRKIADARKKEINKELEQLPARIDEARRSVPQITSVVEPSFIAKLRSDLQTLQGKRAEATAGGEIAQKTTRVREIEGEMIAIQNRLKEHGNPEREAALQAVREKEQELFGLRAESDALKRKISDGEVELAVMDRKLEEKRQEVITESAKQCGEAETCPSCGQAIPAEKLQAARDAFNKAKAEKLEHLVADGKAARTRRDEFDGQIKTWREESAAAGTKITGAESARAAIVVPAETTADPQTNADYQTKVTEKQTLESEIATMRNSGSALVSGIDEQIAGVQARLTDAEQSAAKIAQKEQGDKRVAELEAREKELCALAEDLQRHVFVIEEFIRSKVRMLTDRINSRFNLVEFRLFEEQVNEGLREVCVAMVKGVAWDEGLNQGHKILAGLETIKVLQDHAQFYPMLFVDGAESLTEQMPAMKCQVIRLIAKENESALRVVIEGAKPSPTESTDSREVLPI